MARRVRVRDFYPEGIELEMPDGAVYELEALSVDEMIRLFEAERRLGESGEEGGDQEDHGALTGLQMAQRAIVALLRSRFPDREIPDYSFPPQTVGAVFATLSGAETVADAVRDALIPEPGEEPETGAGAAGDGLREDEPTDVDAGDPLPSTKPSPTPSSDSERIAAGGPSGGESPDAPGPRSPVTSETLVERAAAH